MILYVSHRMEEIFALSDAITVFKDGRYVKTFTDMQQVDHDALVQAMVGRDIGDIYGWQPRSYGEERLRLDAVKAPGRAYANKSGGSQWRNCRSVWSGRGRA